MFDVKIHRDLYLIRFLRKLQNVQGNFIQM